MDLSQISDDSLITEFQERLQNGLFYRRKDRCVDVAWDIEVLMKDEHVEEQFI